MTLGCDAKRLVLHTFAMSMLMRALRATHAQMVCNRASAAALNSSQSHAFRFAHTEAIGKDASEHAEAAQQGTYMPCNEAYEQS